MNKLKTILIDDEQHCLDTLQWQLNTYLPEVEVIACFESSVKALAFMNSTDFDLVFLDIEMPKLNGFELLKKCTASAYDVIFATAYDEFAVKAFKTSAVDYLLKPIDVDDLKSAVQKAISKKNRNTLPDQMELLYDVLHNTSSKRERIALPTHEGVHFIKLKDILYCISESNYTFIYLDGNRKILASKTLKDIESLLPSSHFLRVHHSHLIHFSKIEKYIKSDGGYLIMEDGKNLSVSRSKKNLLLTFLMKN